MKKTISVLTALLMFLSLHSSLALSPEELQAGLQKYLNSTETREVIEKGQKKTVTSSVAQEIFDEIHPIGRAGGITVHAVDIKWKNDVPSSDEKDILAFTIRYTLYWQGPLTKDGFTKIESTFDNESKRFTNGKILATNGMTNAETAYLIGAGMGAALNSGSNGN